jgi:hypothetical protein
MSTAARLAAFAAILAVLFGGGALAGEAFGPDRDQRPAGHEGATATAGGAHGAGQAGHGAASARARTERAAHPVRGLGIAEGGLRVVVDDADLRRGRRDTLRFRIVDDRDRTVRDFDVGHERRMHLIVARRDLTGFRHLHPEQLADGSWRAPVTIREAGSHRLFADFSRDGTPVTLASDLRVDGPADLRALPTPVASAVSDGGHDVRLDAGRVRPGREAELRFTVTADGRSVHTQPYLGAGGHLVALREGDLGFLHVHPTGHGDEASAGHDDATGFAATFPTEGRYRLFLQFKVDGRVETVAFTQEVR